MRIGNKSEPPYVGCYIRFAGPCFAGYEKFDVLWHGKKIAGAAQRRNKLGLLIQGSVQPIAGFFGPDRLAEGHE